MQQNRLKTLIGLALVIYGCSTPNNNSQVTNNTEILVSASPSVSIPDSPANVATPASPKETASPVKQLSSLEIKSIVDSGIVGANNQFAFDLFSELLKKDSKKNIFFSPASISFALDMAYNGADKETKEAIAKVLHIQNLNLDSVNQANKLLLNKLRSPAEDIKLDIANSLWSNKDYEFLPDFINNNKEFYDSKVTNLDFNNVSLADKNATTMNDWISTNTNNRIKNVISPYDFKNQEGNSLAYLINAIYFKSSWTYKFDENNTQDKEFHLSDGTTKQHPMMKQFNNFKYLPPNTYKENKFQGIELPYGKEGKISMYVLLPSYDSNLDELYKTINSSDFNLNEMFGSFYKEGGSITLPKFKIENKYSTKDNYLNYYLDKLGMGIAFDKSNANFFKMAKPKSADENFYISYVAHVANADINEEGTEASAVTVVAASGQASSSPMRTLDMNVNHPFFFMIRDNDTEQILFMGSVTDPQI